MKPSTYIPYEETKALDARVTELEKKLNWHHTAISVLFLLVLSILGNLIVSAVISYLKH